MKTTTVLLYEQTQQTQKTQPKLEEDLGSPLPLTPQDYLDGCLRQIVGRGRLMSSLSTSERSFLALTGRLSSSQYVTQHTVAMHESGLNAGQNKPYWDHFVSLEARQQAPAAQPVASDPHAEVYAAMTDDMWVRETPKQESWQ